MCEDIYVALFGDVQGNIVCCDNLLNLISLGPKKTLPTTNIKGKVIKVNIIRVALESEVLRRFNIMPNLARICGADSIRVNLNGLRTAAISIIRTRHIHHILSTVVDL